MLYLKHYLKTNQKEKRGKRWETENIALSGFVNSRIWGSRSPLKGFMGRAMKIERCDVSPKFISRIEEFYVTFAFRRGFWSATSHIRPFDNEGKNFHIYGFMVLEYILFDISLYFFNILKQAIHVLLYSCIVINNIIYVGTWFYFFE